MKLKCTKCGWIGNREQCAQDELSEGIIDTCPECQGDCERIIKQGNTWTKVRK